MLPAHVLRETIQQSKIKHENVVKIIDAEVSKFSLLKKKIMIVFTKKKGNISFIWHSICLKGYKR